jgi:hypothetical protein
VHCRHCGYALYRTSTRSSARKIYYYRCLGSDAWRYQGKAKCDRRPIRLDLLEHLVWSEIVYLLEDPTLIQTELNRRLEAARNSSPAKRQQESLTRDLAQVHKSMDRLLTAYQEDLLSLNELRRRMPALRQREQRLQGELQSLSAQLADQAAYLRLAESLSAFLARLRGNAQTLDVRDRQRISRLLVKEVVVADDSITIRHSIPTAGRSAEGNGGTSGPLGSPKVGQSDQSYLVRPWREGSALRRAYLAGLEGVTDHHARPQISADQGKQALVADPSGHAGHQDVVPDVVEEFRQVQIDGDAITYLEVSLYLPERSVGGSLWSKAEARFRELWVEDRRHDLRDGLLDHPIHHTRDAQRPLAPARLGDHHPAHRLGAVGAIGQTQTDAGPMLARERREILDAHPVYAGRASIGLHLAPRSVHVLRGNHLLHQSNVQGWLGETTPRPGSPVRVHRRVRVAHGSSLSIHVRPFAVPFLPEGGGSYGLC